MEWHLVVDIDFLYKVEGNSDGYAHVLCIPTVLERNGSLNVKNIATYTYACMYAHTQWYSMYSIYFLQCS